ncbi:MAG: peptidylprolyl isomerase [Candidatus Micrarchaeales archaeon]|jgi:FKBP-type peptidyl-prolyl cis-trans isomerases 2|uniref:Peptidyl-prolyl cis-trans isomerase n=1 Tax=Candidatus Micrarchaeum acidiphilum ARMAN-2 TaxID=425595 RepID=C7DH12_MICA2|nr:MAG: peptidylprolyl isomerase FKBP-type [Candidatus Micrarchaeum acidiphilum ARMAN-2]MCW6161430.1 peptidylprolyl isomerase [Candidatus Micrarchaeales archaeon]
MSEQSSNARSKSSKQSTYLASAIILIVVVLAVGYFAYSGAAPGAVAVGDNVSVFYTGSFTNGTVFNTNVGSAPFNFTVGAGEVIPGFNSAVIGMHVGQNKTVTLPPSEAYGPVNQSLIVQAPLSEFKSTNVTVGLHVSTQSGLSGVVTTVTSNTATVDFNPPLAGKTLIFNIKVVAIRK